MVTPGMRQAEPDVIAPLVRVPEPIQPQEHFAPVLNRRMSPLALQVKATAKRCAFLTLVVMGWAGIPCKQCALYILDPSTLVNVTAQEE